MAKSKKTPKAVQPQAKRSPLIDPHAKIAEAPPAESPPPKAKEVNRASEKETKPKEEPKAEPAKPVKKHAGESQLMAFLVRMNNIGMGKQAGLFVQSVAMMLNAGLPLLDALKIYRLEAHGGASKKFVQKIIESVESGSPLWRAMEEQHLFPPYDISMVRIGEDAGNLARNMEYLTEQREKDRALKSKVKMAMIYPSIILTMMFVLIMGLGIFVLPNLIQVLVSLNADLPISTRIIIVIANAFSTHGTVFVPASFGLIILLFLLAKFTRFKVVAQWVMFHIPGIGRLAKEATIGRFGVILGGLLQAGVPLLEAMESLVSVTTVVAYRNFYAHLLERVQLGDSFAKAFEQLKETKKLLPVSVQQLVITGERSGSLAGSLLKIATIYEKKATETAQVLPVILEPMILLFIGALVGVIAFAIIIPIYSVIGNISGGA